MNHSITSKVCKKCGIEKPLSEYYTHSQGRFYLGDCKACRKLRVKTSVDRRKPIVPSEILLIHKLHSMGIPALPGKTLGQKYADVIAWGCVLIEAKYAVSHSQSTENALFTFRFTYKQSDEGIRGDLLVLMCDYQDHMTYHLMPTNTPCFYRPDGKVKLSVPWTRNRRRNAAPTALTDEIMAQSQDAWHLIEQRRLEISQCLLAGGELPSVMLRK